MCSFSFPSLKQEGYGVIVLNPNENYIEVEKTKAQVQLSSDSSDEPAEKRERKDKIQKDTKKRRDFYEKYRNPQKEKETVQLYIRVSLSNFFAFLLNNRTFYYNTLVKRFKYFLVLKETLRYINLGVSLDCSI